MAGEGGEAPKERSPAERSLATGAVAVEDVDDELDRARRSAERDDLRTDARIRKWLGYGAPIAMAIQLVVADLAFWVYGVSRHWHIPGSAMVAWLAAAVVQVAIIARAITRYLFPPDEPRPSRLRRSASSVSSPTDRPER